MVQQKRIRPVSVRTWVQSLASLSGSGVWCGRELWCKSAAVPLIQTLEWEPPYAAGAAQKPKKNKKKNEKSKKESHSSCSGPCGMGMGGRAVARIQALTWEFPCAVGVAINKTTTAAATTKPACGPGSGAKALSSLRDPLGRPGFVLLLYIQFLFSFPAQAPPPRI